MLISVYQVVKDPNDSTLFICREEQINTDHIVGCRMWHRSDGHRNINGDLTEVRFLKGSKKWFIIINENHQQFRDRINNVTQYHGVSR